jgi:hypothetical protein
MKDEQRQLHDGGDGRSRRRFLKGAALSGGLLAAGGLVGGLPKLAASARSPSQDAEVLNFLLLLEHLQADFYALAIRGGKLKGELGRFATAVGDHERAHVRLLQKLLGARARPKPRSDFRKATGDARTFARTALSFEETVVSAYIGQGANVSPRYLSDLARVTSVEGRHAAWIRDYLGKNPAPQAADPAQTGTQVMSALRRAGYLRS